MAKKKAKSAKALSEPAGDPEAPQDNRVDLDFQQGKRPNTTLADWLDTHSDDEVTGIEKRSDYWRIFLA